MTELLEQLKSKSLTQIASALDGNNSNSFPNNPTSINNQDSLSRSSQLVGDSGTKIYAKALYDFSGTGEADELNLEEDDIIELFSTEADNGWFYGEHNGMRGCFPQSYVRILGSDEVIGEGILNNNKSPDALTPSSIHENENKNYSTEGSTTRSWYNKYRKIPRYDRKREPSSNAITGDENAASASQISPDAPSTAATNSPSVPAIISPVSTPTKLTTHPSSQKITVKKGISQTTLKQVSILGAPAGTRPRWVEWMGGQEAVEKLGLSKKEIHRQEVIYEIITTEKDYVEDLGIIVEVYIKQIRAKKLMRPKDMSVIFSNLEQLLPINQEFLNWLETRQKEKSTVDCIGDLFIRVSDYLKMYTMYCSNHPYAVMKLQTIRQNKQIVKFLDQCAQLPESRHLNLDTFLIKPVQRICKYPLLLREIIKNTESTHQDYETLMKALLKLETVVTIVNEGARQAENIHKMIELQSRFTVKVNIITPSRTLVKTGVVDIIVPSGEKKKRELCLFNDTLIVAKANGDGSLKLLEQIPFSMILINNIPVEDSDSKEFCFEVVHIGIVKFKFAVESMYAKDQWMKIFKETTEKWFQNKTLENVPLLVPTSDNQPSGVQLSKQTSNEEMDHSFAVKPASAISIEMKTDSTTMVDHSPLSVKVNTFVEIAENKFHTSSSADNITKMEISLLAVDTTLKSLDTNKTVQKQQEKPESPQLVTDVLKPKTSYRKPPQIPISNSGTEISTNIARSPSLGSNSQKPALSEISPTEPKKFGSTAVPKTTSKRLANNPFIVQDMNTSRVAPTSAAAAARILRPQHVRATTAAPSLGSTSATSVDLQSKSQETESVSPANIVPTTTNASTISSPHARSASISYHPQILPAPTVNSWKVSSPTDPESPTRPDSPTKRSNSIHPSVRERQERLSQLISKQVTMSPQGMSYLSLPLSSKHYVSRDSSTVEVVGSDDHPENVIEKVSNRIEQLAHNQVIMEDESSTATSQDSIQSTSSSVSSYKTKRKTTNAVNKPVKSATIVNTLRKSSGTSKDYIYEIHVQYIGNDTATIKQTYEDFFDFHIQLIGHFPEEAGVRIGLRAESEATSPQRRIIPDLPGQMMFVSEQIAKQRIQLLQEYIKSILALPPKISRAPVVLSFLRLDGKHAATLTKDVSGDESD
ncbi:Myosin 10A, isoform D [Nowakowskiella sp. JEL0407]|nr:Myosin 10A, isoform D [Nowakowskiella sp. JEL0407]